MAGVPDPVEAAAQAAIPDAQTTGLREELAHALETGEWPLKAAAQVFPEQVPPRDLARYVRTLREPDLTAAHQAYTQYLEDQVDDQMEGPESLLRGLPPEDPLYEAVRDTQRRKHIESQLEDLDFEQLIFQGYAEQEIPVRPGFTVVMRTILEDHGLWIADMMRDEHGPPLVLDRVMGNLQLATSLQSVNGKPLGSDLQVYRTWEQKPDFQKALTTRVQALRASYPTFVVDDLLVQFTWFMGRCRKLLVGNVARKVGNS